MAKVPHNKWLESKTFDLATMLLDIAKTINEALGFNIKKQYQCDTGTAHKAWRFGKLDLMALGK